MSDGTPPKLSGMWGSVSDIVKNIGSVGPAALIGTQPMRNVPAAASSAAPAAAPRAVAPQQPQQSQLLPPPKPGPWQYFKYDTPQMLQAYLDSHNPTDTTIYLDAQMDVIFANTRYDSSLFKDIKFPPIKYLSLNGIKNLVSLKYFNFPDSLTELVVRHTGIYSLDEVNFPPNLIRLRLDNNKINSLNRVKFPVSLQKLDLTDNKINSLNGVAFPPNLTYLQLGNNNIASLWGVHFPPNLVSLTLWGNPISSLKGIIDPSPNVIQLLGEVFPMLHEKSAAKAARQSQKTTIKKMSDLSQQSMQTQLRAVTSFLREGMAARAQQHAEQLLRDRQDKPTTYEESLFYAKLGEKTYPIPMNEELLVQDVLDYLNEHYYISVLHDCDDMHLHKPGMGNLDSGRTLKDCGVVSEEVLDLVCGTRTHQGGFARHRHSRKCNKQYQTRRNKSKSKSKSKPKKNGHGRN